ncbi:hypothetical protein E6P78_11355 [Streptomyces sp. A0958]|uniref:hypothetical protein n=1 Tax=Streptomyces sp. A0958 TaxID=2563101 RepID=UPI00109E8DBE|nr:hypothetical protein [Streptomyces sp. A0958]THA70015.1 hypothetical protein E6P78_11355 [Streptomyces sp. A0958]
MRDTLEQCAEAFFDAGAGVTFLPSVFGRPYLVMVHAPGRQARVVVGVRGFGQNGTGRAVAYDEPAVRERRMATEARTDLAPPLLLDSSGSVAMPMPACGNLGRATHGS